MCVRPKVTNLDKMRVRNHQKKWKPSENHTKSTMDFGFEIMMDYHIFRIGQTQYRGW